MPENEKIETFISACGRGERPFDSLRSLKVVPSEVEGRAQRVEPQRVGVGPHAH